MKKIGILGLQGGIVEHIQILNKLQNIQPIKVKCMQDLQCIDGIILPGGESTSIGLLLNKFNLLKPLRESIINGLPVWGTCAGMILLAKKIIDEPSSYLGVMDIDVKRNAYGSQLNSFATLHAIQEVSSTPIPLVFIRAPYVSRIGKSVTIISKLDNKIIACRQNNILATSFHPELTDNTSFHEYFISML